MKQIAHVLLPFRWFPVRWTLILTRCRLDQQVITSHTACSRSCGGW